MSDGRTPTEHTFPSFDGAEIFYRAWLAEPAAAAGPRHALLVFHRGHEHSGRVVALVRDLALDGVSVFAWDARGHGRSPGERGYAEHVGVLAKDADHFARHVASAHGFAIEDTAVLAHSVGAVIAATWVHDYAPPLRAMVLAAPAFRVKLYVPLAIPALRLRSALAGRGKVKSYVKATMLTHDPDEARAYREDPLVFREIADNVLLDLHDTSRRVVADAAAIHVPTLVIAAGSDWVVRTSEQRRFVEGLSSRVKRFEMLPGFYHAVFHDTGRERPIALARDFLRERFAAPAEPRSLVDADRDGPEKREFDRLSRPSWNPVWPVARGVMKTVGRLSDGIRLGWRSGFDSGVMLDHVYRDEARGTTPLGRWIDRAYLDSIGWRGIRQRKVHLMARLRAAIEATHAAGRPVHVVDVAAGPGRYLLETIRGLPGVPVTATLRDYREENLEAGRRLAAEWGLSNVTFVQGDAFDRASLAALDPRPTIAVVSGLYELFPENGPVRRSLAGLADAVAPGGTLLYTDQPWHPQVEFIARVLRNREGRPWVMRRRSQAEMDDLVREAGFRKTGEDADRWGIFTVSSAVRCA